MFAIQNRRKFKHTLIETPLLSSPPTCAVYRNPHSHIANKKMSEVPNRMNFRRQTNTKNRECICNKIIDEKNELNEIKSENNEIKYRWQIKKSLVCVIMEFRR